MSNILIDETEFSNEVNYELVFQVNSTTGITYIKELDNAEIRASIPNSLAVEGGILTMDSVTQFSVSNGFGYLVNKVPSTTILSGVLPIAVTTITVVSTASFPAQGTLGVAIEDISYTGKTATTFTGCVRARNDTVDIQHFDATSVRLKYDNLRKIKWTGLTLISDAYLASAKTHVSVSSTGSIIQSTTYPSNLNLASQIYIGYITHTASNIIAVFNRPTECITSSQNMSGNFILEADNDADKLTVIRNSGIKQVQVDTLNETNTLTGKLVLPSISNLARTNVLSWDSGTNEVGYTSLTTVNITHGTETGIGLTGDSHLVFQRAMAMLNGSGTIVVGPGVYNITQRINTYTTTKGLSIISTGSPQLIVSGNLYMFALDTGDTSYLNISGLRITLIGSVSWAVYIGIASNVKVLTVESCQVDTDLTTVCGAFVSQCDTTQLTIRNTRFDYSIANIGCTMIGISGGGALVEHCQFISVDPTCRSVTFRRGAILNKFPVIRDCYFVTSYIQHFVDCPFVFERCVFTDSYVNMFGTTTELSYRFTDCTVDNSITNTSFFRLTGRNNPGYIRLNIDGCKINCGTANSILYTDTSTNALTLTCNSPDCTSDLTITQTGSLITYANQVHLPDTSRLKSSLLSIYMPGTYSQTNDYGLVRNTGTVASPVWTQQLTNISQLNLSGISYTGSPDHVLSWDSGTNEVGYTDAGGSTLQGIYNSSDTSEITTNNTNLSVDIIHGSTLYTDPALRVIYQGTNVMEVTGDRVILPKLQTTNISPGYLPYYHPVSLILQSSAINQNDTQVYIQGNRTLITKDISTSSGTIWAWGVESAYKLRIDDLSSLNIMTVDTVNKSVKANKLFLQNIPSSAGTHTMSWNSSTKEVGYTSSISLTNVIITSDTLSVATAKTPASATDTGTTGMICWDSGYMYVCTATDTWKRSAIATW